LRNPQGHETEYTYDALNRRLTLSNPLSQSWETAYSDLTSGGTRVQQTYPGLSSGGSYTVERDFDRLGRLSSIDYDNPTTTPSVRFSYDAAGNRVQMTEYGGTGFTNRIRELFYDYDAARRLVTVQADGDGNGIIDAVVDYEYDAGGLRTKLTLPGNLDVTYVYDAKGQLVSLTDWDSQATTFTHDALGRLLTQERPNGLDSSYTYDPAGRLRLLRHVE